MTIFDAIYALAFEQKHCIGTPCEVCPVIIKAGVGRESCSEILDDAADVVMAWLESMPPEKIDDVCVEDLL